MRVGLDGIVSEEGHADKIEDFPRILGYWSYDLILIYMVYHDEINKVVK